jgi:DNA-binding transcriptional LysR family regulator
MCRSFAGRVLALRVEMVDTLRGSSASGEPRVGFVQDFTDNVLRLAIQRFSALYPLVKLEVAVDL